MIITILPKIKKYGLPALARDHLLIVVLLFIIIIFIAASGKSYYYELREITIPLLTLTFSYYTYYNEKELSSLLLWTCIGIAIMGFYKVFNDIGGLVIIEQYKFQAKNQITPLISSGIVIVLYLILVNAFKGSIAKNTFAMFLLLGLFSILLVARGRAALIITLLLILFVIFNYIKKSATLVMYLIIFTLILVLGYPYIRSALILHYNINNISDISTGRSDRVINGYEYIMDNIWLGELASPSGVPTIHNYLLLKLVNYGIFIGGVFLFLYLRYLIVVIKGCFYNRNNSNIYTLGYILMTIPFLMSLSEYSYPFGPGTTIVINYFMLGQAIYKQQHSSTKIMQKKRDIETL